MILACKAYLTENGKLSIWDESKHIMISKIKVKIKQKCKINVVYIFFSIDILQLKQ